MKKEQKYLIDNNLADLCLNPNAPPNNWIYVSDVMATYASQFKEQPKLSIEERKANFATAISQFKNDYPRENLLAFYQYWSEHSANGKKMRFEKEKVFDIKLRLIRWTKNNKNGQTKTNRNELEALNQSAIQHLKS